VLHRARSGDAAHLDHLIEYLTRSGLKNRSEPQMNADEGKFKERRMDLRVLKIAQARNATSALRGLFLWFSSAFICVHLRLAAVFVF
jgi:hypothetical protein